MDNKGKQELILFLQSQTKGITIPIRAIDEIQEQKHKDGRVCPHCKSHAVVRFGKYVIKTRAGAVKRQRYRCKSCPKNGTIKQRNGVLVLKNRFLVIFFLVVLGSVLTVGDSTYAATKMPGKAISITSTITDEERDFIGYVINGRTYVDVIGILNCLPFQVNSKRISFDSQTKTLKIHSKDFANNPTPLYQFQVGKKSFVANDVVVDMESVIFISSSRMYIPLKDFVRYQNFKITYNQLTHTVLVSK